MGWGRDGFSLDKEEAHLTAALSWNQVFYTVSPLLIQESNEHSMREVLEERLLEVLEERLLPEARDYLTKLRRGFDTFECRMDGESFRTIIVQLRALGLIGKSTRTRSVKDTATYWTLTPFGDNVMNRLRAITRAGVADDLP